MSVFVVLTMFISGLWDSVVRAQPVDVIVSKEPGLSEVLPNEEFNLIVSIDEPIDFYYFSAEVEYDAENFNFLSIETTGLTDGGIKADGEVGNSRIGVSVSRTDTEPISDSGNFLVITFRVNEKADAGEFEFHFDNYEIGDSNGDLYLLNTMESASIEIGEGIGKAMLVLPEVNTINEGELFPVSGKVYASGVTSDESNHERMTAWVGAASNDLDPGSWSEAEWKMMGWDDETESYFHYSAEIGLFRDPGVYFIALRFQLDDGDFYYAGLDGFWRPDENPSAELVITEAPAFRYTVAGWDFAQRQLTPTSSVPVNDLVHVELTGASLSGSDPVPVQTSGGITFLNTNNWHGTEDNPEKYISVVISTEQFHEIQLSSSHTSTPSGPGIFEVQLSLDGEEWESLENGEIDLRETSTVHLQGLPLPEEYHNREAVHIRWLRTLDERQSGNGDTISPSGAHRIGDIQITGTNMEPHRVEVLPGDLNNDGIVNAQDVLALGTYWMSEGPKPVYDFIQFEPREVEAWIPEPATYADANGDGIVNQKDLQPIGLNFGKSAGQLQQVDNRGQKPLARITLPELDTGQWIDLKIRSSKKKKINGISYRLSVDGIDASEWHIDEKLPEWAGTWNEENTLIEFRYKDNHAYEEAISFQGRSGGLEVQEFVVVRIRAEERWDIQPVLSLEWAVFSNPAGSIEHLKDVDIELLLMDQEQQSSELPNRTLLYQNYPNPFNPTTIISYDLSSAATVRLDVFNIIGQHVTTLVHGEQTAGAHHINFDATGLATGIYLYRLQANEKILSRSMMLVK